MHKKYTKIVMAKYEAIYIAVNKVATQSIKNALSVYEEGEEKSHFFKFSFVRNPFDRILSCYCDKILNMKVAPCLVRYGTFTSDMSLSEFIDEVIAIPDDECDVHFKPQHLILPDMNFIGKLENINNDFRYVLNLCGIPHVELKHINKTKYNLTYKDQDIEKIRIKYKKDFERFGYESNILC